MSDPTYDPQAHARELYRENLWLRELLTAVAIDLESLAARRPEADRERQVLLGRARRVRRRMFEGPPGRGSLVQ